MLRNLLRQLVRLKDHRRYFRSRTAIQILQKSQRQLCNSSERRGTSRWSWYHCLILFPIGAACSGKDSPCSCNSCLTCGPGISKSGPCGEAVKVIQWRKEELSNCFLIRQANVALVDSVTRILTLTLSALEHYHAEYRNATEELLVHMELGREAPESDQEIIQCQVVAIRNKMSDIKETITDLDMYVETLERLSHSSAESAFSANADTASILLMERLQSVLLQVKALKTNSIELEHAVNELQALIIIESGEELK